MRKLFGTILFLLLYSSISFGQPTVYIPLVASEETTQELSVGLDLTATNCIDLDLGEAEAPPPPPPGSFHIVFDLDPYGCGPITTWNDYRNVPAFPFSGEVQHTLSWQRSATGTTIEIQYDLPDSVTLTIQDILGGTILDLGPFTGIGTTAIPGTYPLNSAFVLMNYYNVVPVELTSFTATVSDQDVLLNWSTATETNNSGFEIERKAGSLNTVQGSQWEKIGFVPGAGTTTEQREYSYSDENISYGTYHYRLKQIDYDGSFNYSNEVEVTVGSVPDAYGLFQNYPNPFNPTTTIKFQVPEMSNVTVKVFNMLGQEIATLFSGQVNIGQYSVSWDGSSSNGSKVSSGIYIYSMTAGDFVETKRMMLLK